MAYASGTLAGTFSAITAYPLTMCCFGQVPNSGSFQAVFELADSASQNRYLGLLVRPNINGKLRFEDVNSQAAWSSTDVPFNSWFSAVGVSNSAASRDVYVDAGSKGSNTGSQTFTDLAYVLSRNNPRAEVAVWTAALTEDEINSLAKGFKPSRIRPQSLLFYAPCVRELLDARGGIALTPTDLVVGNHPRVY